MSMRPHASFALRETQGKWSVVAELDRLEDAGDLLARIGQAEPDLPVERYDPTTATWREVGRVPLAGKTAELFPPQRKRSRPKSRLGPALLTLTLVIAGGATLARSGIIDARVGATSLGIVQAVEGVATRGLHSQIAPQANQVVNLKEDLVGRVGPITTGIFCTNEIDVDRLIASASQAATGSVNDDAISNYTAGVYGINKCWDFRKENFSILNVTSKTRTVLGSTNDPVDLYKIEAHCPSQVNGPYCRDGRAFGVKMMNAPAEGSPPKSSASGKPIYAVSFVNSEERPLAFIDFSPRGANMSNSGYDLISEIDRNAGFKIQCSSAGYGLYVKNDDFDSPGEVVAASGLVIDFVNLPLREDRSAPTFKTFGPKGYWLVAGPVIGQLLNDLANSQSVRAWSKDYQYDPAGWIALKRRCDAVVEAGDPLP